MFAYKFFMKSNLNLKHIIPMLMLPLGLKFNSLKNKSVCLEGQNDNVEIDDYLDKIEKKLNKLIQIRRGTYMKDYPNLKQHETLKKIISPFIYKRFKDVTTKEGFTLNDIIQAGIDNPTSSYHLIAPSRDAYYKFQEIFENYFRTHFITEDFTKSFENESYSMTKSMLIGMEDVIKEYFLEVDFTSHRNLINYPFPSKISRRERTSVKNIIREAILNLEKDVFVSEGKFKNIRGDEEVRRTFDDLFKSAGVYRDWPEDRLIYINDDSRFLCLVNEEDHLKVKTNSNNPQIMKDLMIDYFYFLEKLESKLDFAVHKNFGFLNTNPINVGTGTYFKIKLKISPDETKNQELLKKFEESKKDLDLTIKKEDEEFTYLIISNINPFYTFSTLLVEILGAKEFLK